MRTANRALIVLVAAVLLAGNGCTMYQFHRLGPNSHFTYPNSNTKALGPVKVKVDGAAAWLRIPDFLTSDIDQKVYNAAMKQVDGSNVVLDYVRTTTVKEFFGIYWSEEYLEGTAGRMTVGQQKLQ
jgi:hypothetical protein